MGRGDCGGEAVVSIMSAGHRFAYLELDSPKMVRIPIIVRSRIARTKLVLNPSKKGMRMMAKSDAFKEGAVAGS